MARSMSHSPAHPNGACGWRHKQLGNDQRALGTIHLVPEQQPPHAPQADAGRKRTKEGGSRPSTHFSTPPPHSPPAPLQGANVLLRLGSSPGSIVAKLGDFGLTMRQHEAAGDDGSARDRGTPRYSENVGTRGAVCALGLRWVRGAPRCRLHVVSPSPPAAPFNHPLGAIPPGSTRNT